MRTFRQTYEVWFAPGGETTNNWLASIRISSEKKARR